MRGNAVSDRSFKGATRILCLYSARVPILKLLAAGRAFRFKFDLCVNRPLGTHNSRWKRKKKYRFQSVSHVFQARENLHECRPTSQTNCTHSQRLDQESQALQPKRRTQLLCSILNAYFLPANIERPSLTELAKEQCFSRPQNYGIQLLLWTSNWLDLKQHPNIGRTFGWIFSLLRILWLRN